MVPNILQAVPFRHTDAKGADLTRPDTIGYFYAFNPKPSVSLRQPHGAPTSGQCHTGLRNLPRHRSKDVQTGGKQWVMQIYMST